ncbi:MAG: hypothetical protein H6737_28350 [Alphaproteobacteria bacterium]|nr:hypothetical protein [Alphaproteobacteria bacterium]
MLTLLLAAHASTAAPPENDPCDGTHWEELSLPVLLECVYGTNGADASVRVLTHHRTVFETLPPDVTPSQEAHLALTWAERVAGFERGPLMAAMTGVVIERRSAERIAELWPLLDADDRRGIAERAARLRRSGIPDLTAERASLGFRVSRTWELAPWSSWCVATFDDAVVSVEPLLHLPDEDRASALQTWTDARPRSAVLPWKSAGLQCTEGLGEILIDWHELRVDANARWRTLSMDGALL